MSKLPANPSPTARKGTNNMTSQKRKFELFARLQALGFTYNEAASLRRIEMTLQRWAERECGDGSDWAIERDEVTGKPFNTYHGEGKARRYAIADKEAGALRRLARIVKARNLRESPTEFMQANAQDWVFSYNQGDCRGCMLYLVTRGQVGRDHIDSVYTRGLAVCA